MKSPLLILVAALLAMPAVQAQTTTPTDPRAQSPDAEIGLLGRL
jgi:hypothetical protein